MKLLIRTDFCDIDGYSIVSKDQYEKDKATIHAFFEQPNLHNEFYYGRHDFICIDDIGDFYRSISIREIDEDEEAVIVKFMGNTIGGLPYTRIIDAMLDRIQDYDDDNPEDEEQQLDLNGRECPHCSIGSLRLSKRYEGHVECDTCHAVEERYVDDEDK